MSCKCKITLKPLRSDALSIRVILSDLQIIDVYIFYFVIGLAANSTTSLYSLARSWCSKNNDRSDTNDRINERSTPVG